MQLTSKSNATGKTKKVANVNTALAAATCVLLGTIPVVQADEGVWETVYRLIPGVELRDADTPDSPKQKL